MRTRSCEQDCEQDRQQDCEEDRQQDRQKDREQDRQQECEKNCEQDCKKMLELFKRDNLMISQVLLDGTSPIKFKRIRKNQ